MKLNLALACLVLLLAAACAEADKKADTAAPEELSEASEAQADLPSNEKASDAPQAKVEDAALVADTAKPEPPVLGQDDQFEEFKEKFLDAYWKLNPSRGVYVGYYKYDDQLLVPNGELRALRRQFYVNELNGLKRFDANKLSSANASDLAIIEGQLKSKIWYIDSFREYDWNPSKYNPAGAFGVILNTDYKPLPERIATISSRLQNVPAYYQAAIENIKVPTNEHLSLAIQQSSGALKMFTRDIPAKLEELGLDDLEVDKLEADESDVDESEVDESALDESQPDDSTPKQTARKEIESRLAAAATAVESYISFLQSKQAELSESGQARGFRIGAELYEKKFKYDIQSSYTAAELYDLALAAKAKLHSEMITLTKGLWPKYFAEEPMPEDELVAVKQMIDKLSAKHVSRDKFVDEIRRQIPIIQKFMDDKELLDSDPTRPLIVRLTPEYQRGFAGASVNAPGPYDATANTYYNVSPLDDFSDEQASSYLREYNHWILQILNIHEAIPGHYTQLMHANKSPSKIKSIFANGAMVEGWAVYSERMMLENGYGDNEPEMWLMYSKWNLRVVVNTILDYSVQVLGMQRDAALEMLRNEAFQEQAEAEGKWRRATISQVQLTSYFTGYSEIYAFREDLKAAMGDDFDLREFHNKFLSYGNAPVPVIKNLMLADLGVSLELE